MKEGFTMVFADSFPVRALHFPYICSILYYCLKIPKGGLILLITIGTIMQAGSDPNIDFTGRELFQIEWDYSGFNLNEIVNHENTRYDNRLKTWGLGDEIGMFHCYKYRNLNHGTDWIIYLTYHDDQNSADYFFQFSLIPPRTTDILLVIRGMRKSPHFPIVAYETNLTWRLGDESGEILDNESPILSPLPSDCQKLTDFMEQCRSWHESPDLRIV